MTAGLIFRLESRWLVAFTPAFMAGRSMMSVPGNPVLAARRAKSGHGTRPCNKTLFKERYMPGASAKAREKGAAASNRANVRLDSRNDMRNRSYPSSISVEEVEDMNRREM